MKKFQKIQFKIPKCGQNLNDQTFETIPYKSDIENSIAVQNTQSCFLLLRL